MKQKNIKVKNTFNHEMTIKKISRPLKIYYNSNGEPYFNYQKIRYYLNDFNRFDSPFVYKKNGAEQVINGYYALSFFYTLLAQVIEGYDPKIILYYTVSEKMEEKQ